MSRISLWVGVAVGMLAIPTVPGLAAVPPVENLLPATTRLCALVPSIRELETNFDKTQLGHLIQDPLMQPFMESLKEQLRTKWLQTHQKLGLTWNDLKDVPTGEVGLAMIQPSEKESAQAIVADVTGNLDKANALLEKVNKNLTAQKGVRSQRTLHGATVTVFDVPKKDDQPAHQVAYTIKDNILSAADNVKVIEGILARQAEARSDSLASLGSFSTITKRCLTSAGQLAPHARWFLDPFGYADLSRLDHPKPKGTDMLKILKDQGFTAVQGIGGFVNFAVDTYELLHRTWIHAPGHVPGPERFKFAAAMLDLPNGGSFAPPEWVPRDVASYIAVNLNVPNAFESSKTLVDQVVGDEVFEEVLESIRTDKNGPKIDMRSELIAYLANRITIISDLQLPITPKSERVCFAVETTNPVQLAKTMERWMEADPDTRRREINGHTVWEQIDRESEMPMVTIENTPALGIAPPVTNDEEEEKPMLPNSAYTVAFGQMFVATHIDILAKVLADVTDRGKLADSVDFARIQKDIQALRQPEQSVELFTRTDDAYRGVYDLLRTGRMPEAESFLGKLLNALMGEGKEGALRTQRIDGSKLPEYELVRRYFGPAGMTLTTEETGWFLTGFSLSKEGQ